MLSSKSNSIIKAWAVLPMLLLFQNSISQIGFNKRFFSEHSSRLESVNITEGGYVVAGWSSDPADGNHFDLLIVNLDVNGEITAENKYGNSQRYFWSIGKNVSELPERFLQQSVGPRNDTAAINLTWFDHLGDTLFTRDFRSIYLNMGWALDYFISPPFAYLNSDSTAYLTAIVSHESTFSDAVLYKFDPQGHELWHYVHATLSDPDAIYAVVPHQGGVIVGIFEDGYTNNPANDFIVKLNSAGLEQWHLNSDDFLPGRRGNFSLLCDNDTLVIAGLFEDYDSTIYYPIASIYKVDTLGSVIWSNTYGEYTQFEMRTFTNVVKTTDGNYVCGGTWTTIPGSEEIPVGQVNDDYDQFAHIVKFDRDNGNIIWERNYRWLETYRDNHSLNDMKATPDGGVIFCGEANDLYHIYEPPYQQAWVVKLDACGCLVPGCDTECTVGVGEMPEGPRNDSNDSKIQLFKFGPNPAYDMLNVFVGAIANADLHNASIAIYDLQGKLMKSFVVKYANTTYMMDVSEMASGEYVMGFMNDGVVLQSESLVVVQR